MTDQTDDPAAETVTLPPKVSLPAIRAGSGVQAIVPHDLEEAYRMSTAIFRSGLAPYGFKNPEAVMVAIMGGAEIGLTPIQSLQSLAVINGRLCMYGDVGLALIRASGKLASFKEWIEGADDERVAICKMVRIDDPEPIERRFSVAEAKTAGLWDGANVPDVDKRKKSPWVTYKARMLAFRARWFAMRDGFSDVLKGIGGAEEVMDIPPVDITPPPPRQFDPAGGKKIEPTYIDHRPAADSSGVAPPAASEGSPLSLGGEGAEASHGQANAKIEPIQPLDNRTALEQSMLAELGKALDGATSLAEVDVVVDEFEGAINATKGATFKAATEMIQVRRIASDVKPGPRAARKVTGKQATGPLI